MVVVVGGVWLGLGCMGIGGEGRYVGGCRGICGCLWG